MTPRFLFRPAAVDELLEARDWYDAQRPGLGDELAEVVAHTLDLIAAQPDAFPEVIPGVRRAVISRFRTASSIVALPMRLKYSPSFITAATRRSGAIELPYNDRCS